MGKPMVKVGTVDPGFVPQKGVSLFNQLATQESYKPYNAQATQVANPAAKQLAAKANANAMGKTPLVNAFMGAPDPMQKQNQSGYNVVG